VGVKPVEVFHMTDSTYDHNALNAQQPEPNTLRVENEVLRRGFTIIPNYVLKSRELSRDAKLLYGILLSYAWQKGSCFPGYDTLMEDLQCGRPQLAKYIKELRESGLIEVQRRGQGKTSIYTIKDLPGDPPQKFQNETSRSTRTKKFQNETSRSSESKPPVVPNRNAEEDSVKKTQKEEYSLSIRKPSQKNDKNRAGKRKQESPSGNPPPIAGSSISATATPRTAAPESTLPESVQPPRGIDSPAYPPGAARGLSTLGEVLAVRRQRGQRYDEDRQAILELLADFRREFNDQATLKQSVSRCYNLLQRSGLEIGTFTSKMYEARAITKEHSASIRSILADSKSISAKHKMAYWFAVLEDLCGLKPVDPSQSSSSE
jgi:biotin operon repressor